MSEVTLLNLDSEFLVTELHCVDLVEQESTRPTLTSISEKIAQSFEDAREELYPS